MNMRYNITKSIVGVINAGFLFYMSVRPNGRNEFHWWDMLAAIVLVILLVRSVPFMKGQECVWIFTITMFATIPFNIRLSRIAVRWCLGHQKGFSGMMCSLVAFMCLFAIEEIISGILARLIWPRQKLTYLCEEEKEV